MIHLSLVLDCRSERGTPGRNHNATAPSGHSPRQRRRGSTLSVSAAGPAFLQACRRWVYHLPARRTAFRNRECIGQPGASRCRGGSFRIGAPGARRSSRTIQQRTSPFLSAVPRSMPTAIQGLFGGWKSINAPATLRHILPAFGRHREAEEARARRLHAKTAHDPQRHGPYCAALVRRCCVARAHSCLTFKTVANAYSTATP
jgi:hypothetical protein